MVLRLMCLSFAVVTIETESERESIPSAHTKEHGSESLRRKISRHGWEYRISATPAGCKILNARFRIPEIVALVLCGFGSTSSAPYASLPPEEFPVSITQIHFGGILPSPSPAAPQVVSHGPRTEKRIALTFDACATRSPSHYDERVTRVLVEENVPATIFLGGKWMEEEQEHVRQLASVPQFELGNHTYLHPHLIREGDERITEELQKTEDILFSLTGHHATLFRPPYGEYNDRVVRIAAGLGLTTIEYDLPSGDPDTHATKEKLIDYVTHMVQNGSIIVMHINRRGWHTAEALPEIIRRLRARGFTFVTVGDLLGGHPGER